MSETENPTGRNMGMIVLASGQMMPNVLGFLHFRPQLKKLRIYSTQKMQESAKRFEDWCMELEPKLDTKIAPSNFVDPDESIQPENIKNQIHYWVEEEAESENLVWVVNATGGTKMMAFGLVAAIENSKVPVIYRDFDMGWCEIYSDAKTKQIKITPFEVKSNLSDSVSLESLAALHTGDTWNISPCDVWEDGKLLAVTESALKNGWQWDTAFRDNKLTPSDSPAKTFELYVGALCQKLGAATVGLNAIPQIGEQGIAAENDVVVLHNNSIFILDCKLTKETGSFATEIYDTRQRVSDMGGLSAKGRLIRPNRFEISEGHRGLAQPNVDIWGSGDCFDIIDKLAKLLDITDLHWPQEIRGIKCLFEQQRIKGQPLFAWPQDLSHISEGNGKREFPGLLLNLTDILNKQSISAGHPDWKGYLEDGRVTLIFQCNRAKDTRDRLREFFKKFVAGSTPVEVQISKNNTARVSFQSGIKMGELNGQLGSKKLWAELQEFLR